MVGVAVSRILFGPEAAPDGIVIGAAALVVGTLLSWQLHRLRRPADSPSVPRGLRLRRRAHPMAWIGPVAGSIITMVAWAGVAHSSGSGWVQSVGALLGAILLVGLLVPAVPAGRAQVTCTNCPSDARAGEHFELTVEVDRPVRVRPLYPVGSEHQAGGLQRGTQRRATARRGVLDAVVVEVASSAPFGLLWWARDVELVLPRLLHVAPRSGLIHDPLITASDAHGEAMQRVPSGFGEPRGVRPYAPGDPRHAVHWPATAHAGEAERMMAAVGHCLARRRPVVLITREPGGRVVRPVADPVDLGRRLARAVAG
jgi:hypothetical protein